MDFGHPSSDDETGRSHHLIHKNPQRTGKYFYALNAGSNLLKRYDA